VSAASPVLAAEEFHAPGLNLFEFPPLWDGAPAWVSKPTLLALLGVMIVCVFFYAAFSAPKLVPRGVQNLGEMAYEFVREQIARPFLGRDTDRWMPLLVSLFFLVWMWNFMGVLILAQLPVASHFAYPVVLAAFVYLLVQYLGVKAHGVGGYLKSQTVPPGLPKGMYVLVTPIEFLSTFIVRPFTHAVRLWATMFAGHILLALFATVGWHFLFAQLTPLGAPVGVLGVLMTIVLTGFEMFIQALQAYVFTMLTAMFIGGALHPEH
jgi:F-type H+-transporting ATPase subunit a